MRLLRRKRVKVQVRSLGCVTKFLYKSSSEGRAGKKADEGLNVPVETQEVQKVPVQLWFAGPGSLPPYSGQPG